MSKETQNSDREAGRTHLDEISSVLNEIEKKVVENRETYNDTEKNIKDFRRIFDQDSSRMNQAIFNDAPPEEIHQETLRTISILIEILSRSNKK